MEIEKISENQRNQRKLEENKETTDQEEKTKLVEVIAVADAKEEDRKSENEGDNVKEEKMIR